MRKGFWTRVTAVLATGVAGCDAPPDSGVMMQQTGALDHPELVEVSGLQASRGHPGVFWAHNDDGPPDLWALNADGSVLGRFRVLGARNRDWEDLTLVPAESGDMLVVADTGDNHARYPSAQLWFVTEPDPSGAARELEPLHRLDVTYAGGPRDVEAIAWDPHGERLLLLSKRDRPPRLYAVGLEAALTAETLMVEPLGTVDSFRSPSLSDSTHFGRRAGWVSQPTGMDIAPDGSRAAVITYRSLYLYERPAAGGWLEGLRSEPLEFTAPPGDREEAVSFSADGSELFVIPEGHRAPVWRFVFTRQDQSPTSTP